jgi:hypothetical protein
MRIFVAAIIMAFGVAANDGAFAVDKVYQSKRQTAGAGCCHL